MNILKINSVLCIALLMLAGCSTPAVRPDTSAPIAPAASTVNTPDQSQPVVAPQIIAAPAEALPSPPTRSYTLNAASTALVTQAHTQLAAKNFLNAAATIERALRIEPNNPLLWLEYAQVRLNEQSYFQSESMARKALMLANGDPHTQSTAWRLIASSLRAQNKSNEAQQADAKADALQPQ
jgi:predicted Zn-dependent protease